MHTTFQQVLNQQLVEASEIRKGDYLYEISTEVISKRKRSTAGQYPTSLEQ